MKEILYKIKSDITQKEKVLKAKKQDKEMYYSLIKIIDKDITKLSSELSDLQQKYNSFYTGSLISDHATLRYLERTDLINIKELKDALLTDEVKTAILFGVDKIISNGYEFRIKNGKVVTIIKEGCEE